MEISKILMLFVILTTNKGHSQNNSNFYLTIATKRVGQTSIVKNDSDTSWTTYLGRILNKNKRTLYYVVKEFSKTKAASTWHGHSKIYFLTVKRKLFATFDAGMPENLPYKLFKNNLYFKYLEKGTVKEYKQHIDRHIPKWFCTAPSSCDTIMFD